MGYMEVYKSWCDNMYFDEATRDESLMMRRRLKTDFTKILNSEQEA